jgi:hypothetical protein
MWGIQSGMVWEGELLPARDLIINKLLPMAREGLEMKKINGKDIDRFLGIIEERAKALWENQVFAANSGAGVRGTTRLARLLPIASAIMAPAQ